MEIAPPSLPASVPDSSFIVHHSSLNSTFACKRCHRVKFLSRLQNEAWNDVIAYLTQGLLYGKEVSKPDWFTPARKRPYKPMPFRVAPRREQVLDRLLRGHARSQIDADLHMTKGAVDQQTWKV